jgi:hypothetical protein
MTFSVSDKKFQFTYTYATLKDVQEAFSPKKRTSSTKKNLKFLIFFLFCGSFLPS